MSEENQNSDIDKDSLIEKLKEEIEELKSELSFYKEKLDEAIIVSVFDPLTGIYNRNYLNKRLSEEITRCGRYNHPFSFLMLSVDRLKEYGESLGYTARDHVIKSLAGTLKRSLRALDVAARLDEEVFVSIFPQTAKVNAIHVTERLKEQVDNELRQISSEFSLSASIALSTYPDDASSREELLEKTDHALYLARSGGGNKVMYL
jgi:diguanylate cyclase (GGDEF)-like protein